MTETRNDAKDRLTQAVLAHVPFDGWSAKAFEAAICDSGVDPDAARRICPRGAIDLAVNRHRQGDAALGPAFVNANTADLRYSEQVALAIQLRLDIAGDKEIVRKASALFALPYLATEGGTLIWGTADAIWTALGDTSRDFNWYSKRAILSGVYSSCVLFWLGDTGNGEATSDFIDRRIADVMRFEKFKANARKSKTLGPFARGIEALTEGIRAPSNKHRSKLPGFVRSQDTP